MHTTDDPLVREVLGTIPDRPTTFRHHVREQHRGHEYPGGMPAGVGEIHDRLEHRLNARIERYRPRSIEVPLRRVEQFLFIVARRLEQGFDARRHPLLHL